MSIASNFPFPQSIPFLPVSNSEFLTALFPGLPELTTGWVCTFEGDPGESDGRVWRGRAYRPGDNHPLEVDQWAEQQNTFTTFAAFKGEPGDQGFPVYPGRRKGLFAGAYGVMLDDIGTGKGAKLEIDRLAPIPPSWVIETSPDNYQVGYLLDRAVLSGPLYAAFLDCMVYTGLQEEKDPGMLGVTRYGRLPVGVNGKAKYRRADASAPEHVLVHWRPDCRYSLRDLAAAYGIAWEQVEERAAALEPGAEVGVVDAQDLEDDEWGKLLSRATPFGDRMDKGTDGVWYHLECPWIDEHTDRADSGSAYRVGGGYSCFHGHCIERTQIDLQNWLCQHSDPLIQAAAWDIRLQEAFGGAPVDAAPEIPAEVDWYGELDEEIKGLMVGVRPEKLVEVLQRIDMANLGEIAEGQLINGIKASTGTATGLLKDELKRIRKEKRDAARLAATNEEHKKQAKDEDRTYVPVVVLPEMDFPDVGPEGGIFPSTRNILKVVQGANAWIRFNEMSRSRDYLRTFAGWSGEWVIQWIRDSMMACGAKFESQSIRMAVGRIAEEESFHPFEEWLDTLQWDGVGRVRQVMETLQVPKGEEAHRDLVLRRWLSSIIAAGRHLYKRQPGTHPRGVCVLQGPQYSGKTTWFRLLFSNLFPGSLDCFGEGAHFAQDKDSTMGVLRHLVTELGELDTTFSKTEIGALKAFISTDVDRIRRPYAEEHVDYDRRTIFCGTVNDERYLRDATGNTRFWTISADKIDLEAMRAIDMTQFWAELDQYVRAEDAVTDRDWRKPWVMSHEEVLSIEEYNDRHREVTALEQTLRDVFDWEDPKWNQAEGSAKFQINPMRTTQIMELLTGRKHAPNSRETKELNSVLIRMTGEPHARNTGVTLTRRGVLCRVKGRLWPMPPENSDVYGEENISALTPH